MSISGIQKDDHSFVEVQVVYSVKDKVNYRLMTDIRAYITAYNLLMLLAVSLLPCVRD